MSLTLGTEKILAEDILEKLLKFIPVLDESTEFILKYQHDFVFHYNKEFYNLALFSFHYLYMFVLATSMVKYAEFKHANIKAHSGNSQDIEGVLYGHFGERAEKKIICHIPSNECIVINKKRLNVLHCSNVSLRDDIAHASGRTITPIEIDAYINNCFEVLENLQKISIIKYLNSKNIRKKLKFLNEKLFEYLITENYTDMDFDIMSFLRDYYISFLDSEFILESEKELPELVFLLNYINLSEGEILFSFDASENHYKSIYDWFHSNYTYVDKTTKDEALYVSAIKNKAYTKFKNINPQIIESIFYNIKNEASKWVEIINN